MEKVIVAFENETSSWRLREILESSGSASCVLCRSADQVRRAMNKLRINAIVCSYKLGDDTAESLYKDLPQPCAMLAVSGQNLPDLCGHDGIRTLISPVPRGNLIAAVQELLQDAALMERSARPRRSEAEEVLIRRAKERLMLRHGLDEEEAHRFLQRRSMDSGVKLIQAARQVLEER